MKPRYTFEQFVDIVANSKPHLTISEFVYINGNTSVPVTCNDCGYKSLIKASWLLETASNKSKCKNCSKVRKKTTEEFKQEIASIHPNIEILSEYKAARFPIDCKCNTCNNHWSPTANKLHQGRGCPVCSKLYKSVPEIIIKEFLKHNNIEFEQEKRFDDCRNILPLPFDFYIQSLNMIIEYHGEQHYISTNGYNKKYGHEYRIQNDTVKENFCKQKGIKLVIINGIR